LGKFYDHLVDKYEKWKYSERRYLKKNMEYLTTVGMMSVLIADRLDLNGLSLAHD